MSPKVKPRRRKFTWLIVLTVIVQAVWLLGLCALVLTAIWLVIT